MLYYTLRLVHIAAMAVWFGSTLFLLGDLRRTLAAGPAHADLLIDRLTRGNRIAAITGWTTLLSGVALIFQLGGMGAVPVPIHISLLLALVLVGTGIGTGRAAIRAANALKAGQDPEPARKQAAMFGMISHTLWTVILILMVFRAGIG